MNNITKTYILPAQLSDNRLDLILNIVNQIEQEGSAITLDLSKNLTISPAGYAVMCCIIDSACEHRVLLKFININSKNLIHCKLQEIIKIQSCKKGFISGQILNYTTPNQINILKVSSIAPEVILMLEEKFLERIGAERLWNVKLALNELMQNSVDHSTSERYFIYAGIFDQNFEFGVLDRGVSIPSKIETKYHASSDQSFIGKSLKLGVGTRRNRIGGMGLYYLFENIKEEKGKLVIISRHGQVRRYFSARKVISSATKVPLRGTWYFAKFSLEKKC